MTEIYDRNDYKISVENISGDLYIFSADIDYGFTTYSESYTIDPSKDRQSELDRKLDIFAGELLANDLAKTTLDESELDSIKRLWCAYRQNMLTIGSDDWLSFEDFTNWISEQIDEIENA